MKDLYKRLRRVGFDETFVRRNLLPEWWDDSLGSVPSNRAMAEASISRMLGFSIVALRDHNRELELPAVAEFRLKRVKSTDPTDIAPAVLLAYQGVRSLLEVIEAPAFKGLRSAANVREAILKKRQFVDLSALLQFSWDAGIPVFHLPELPKPSKKFAGMALFCGDRPAIVLASGRDSLPWVAYQLAHELGHILRGHVRVGSDPLIDIDFGKIDDHIQETEADRFACEVLTGNPEPKPPAIYGMTADKLVAAANHAARTIGVDPGVYALVYGRNADRMGPAQNALKIMGLDRGARTIIASTLRQHLMSDLPESAERFVSLMTM